MGAIDGALYAVRGRAIAVLVARGLKRRARTTRDQAHNADYPTAHRDHSREWSCAALARQRALGGDRADAVVRRQDSVMDFTQLH